jgi:hypothetical protein
MTLLAFQPEKLKLNYLNHKKATTELYYHTSSGLVTAPFTIVCLLVNTSYRATRINKSHGANHHIVSDVSQLAWFVPLTLEANRENIDPFP